MADVTNSRLLLSALVKNEEYLKQLLPYIQEDYFEDASEKRMFQLIREYAGRYSSAPDRSTLLVQAKNDKNMDEGKEENLTNTINDVLSIIPTNNMEFLRETTENQCRERAIYNALTEAIAIYSGNNSKVKISAVPDLLSKAISVSFDEQIGQEYYEDASIRQDQYTNPESKIPFLIDVLNEITNGGVCRKTECILVTGTNVGKSMGLVSLASDYLRQGLNVAYFSMEMREEVVFQRVDANLMKIDMNKIHELGKEKFMGRVEALKSKSYGKMYVKEFPPTSASVLNFKQTLEEWKLKKGFVPDVIVVDYLQIVASYRLAASAGSYFVMKAVAEELRALAVETNTVLWTATQLNRGQMVATDVDLTGISESAGIAHTADLMLALIRTDELDQIGQLICKQLKSRFANKSNKTTFSLGVSIEMQTLYGLDDDKSDQLTQMDSKFKVDTNDLQEKFKNQS